MFFDVYSSLCELKQKTPNGVAKELGFPSSSVTQWKHGSTPRPNALQKIADYFGVSVHYLLGAKEKTAPINESGIGPNMQKLLEEIKPLDEDQSLELLKIIESIKRIKKV